jgi:RNA polymerase sigma-70 factor (ECF subfamily)
LLGDAELIQLVQSGQVEAFGELYVRYLDPIYRYVRSRVENEVDAEDLTETVFLRSFQSLNGYQDRGWPFSAFLYQVARNVLADHYRQRREEDPLESAQAMASGHPSPDEWIDQREQVSQVEQALAELPADYQEVIRLRVILNLPTATVAGWIGRSDGATRVLLYRALKALRRELAKDDAESVGRTERRRV